MIDNKEEMNMAERMQVQDEYLDEVVGGAFQFYKDRKTGEWKCLVDDYGTFSSTSDGFFKYINLKNANPNANGAELFELCKAARIIW